MLSMTPSEAALITAVLASGLFAGLMFSLLVLLLPKWRAMDAADYFRDIQPFLQVGKGNRAVALVLFLAVFAGPAALFLPGGPPDGLWRVLVSAGSVLFIVGPLGVTLLFNLPLYREIMDVDPQAPRPGGQSCEGASTSSTRRASPARFSHSCCSRLRWRPEGPYSASASHTTPEMHVSSQRLPR
jgi:uncharacterized membrane protein